MLTIVVPGYELYDEENNEFIYQDDVKLQLEHSLVSISKWESKWCKPFLDKKSKTPDEIIDYVRCMTITKDVDDDVYERLTRNNVMDINEYLEAPMTATTFAKDNGSPNREIITSELIYYWMISYNIPINCQFWHINRLLTLIKVFNVKNSPPKKMSKQEIYARNRELNRQRRQQLNSNG